LDEQAKRSQAFLDGLDELMGKKGKVVQVPEASDMDTMTFLKHIDARHSHEVKTEKKLAKFPHIAESWVGTYRAFHERLHMIAAPGQYDHTHEEDW
jgi:hypothetical protein